MSYGDFYSFLIIIQQKTVKKVIGEKVNQAVKTGLSDTPSSRHGLQSTTAIAAAAAAADEGEGDESRSKALIQKKTLKQHNGAEDDDDEEEEEEDDEKEEDDVKVVDWQGRYSTTGFII